VAKSPWKNEAYCKAFGSHVRQLREAKGYGLREFALLADMEYSTLSDIERGVNNTTISTVLRLADNLGVTPSELFDFKFSAKSSKR
jgi:transcriptional regulator with XRE-family HTH domain